MYSFCTRGVTKAFWFTKTQLYIHKHSHFVKDGCNSRRTASFQGLLPKDFPLYFHKDDFFSIFQWIVKDSSPRVRRHNSLKHDNFSAHLVLPNPSGLGLLIFRFCLLRPAPPTVANIMSAHKYRSMTITCPKDWDFLWSPLSCDWKNQSSKKSIDQ